MPSPALSRLLVGWLALQSVAFLHAQPPALELDSQTAAPRKLAFGNTTIPTEKGGGFSVREFKDSSPQTLTEGRVEIRDGALHYTATGDQLRLTASFIPLGEAIRVTGEIESSRQDDRAIVLSYTLPLPAGQSVLFESELSRSLPLETAGDSVSTVYPLAAATGRNWGVALAIPPTFPAVFGLRGDRAGLSLEFYLGLTPLTKAFPNRARFEFIIDSAKPGWGFRSALAQYYERHAEFYTPRFQGAGFWNWQEKGEIEHALHLFRYQGIPRSNTFFKDLERNKRLNILTLDYVIVGQRELRNLETLPGDYAEVQTLLKDTAEQWDDPASPARVAYKHWRDADLPQLIEHSGVALADGSLRYRTRDTTWGKNSVTFTMNPNPDLFSDREVPTVGASTLKTIAKWYEEDPIDGIMVDSLGNQWPSTLNFRRDHFPYARYPLTFDHEGRVALHNRVSHYEFIESLRKLSVEKGKYVMANGICRYNSSGGEHYNSRENGRFFMASQLDTAGREITADLDRPLLEFFRTSMGPKLFTALLYKWNDADEVRRQMNRALAYDVFAGPLRCFLDDISYLKSEDGFYRDKELLEWFIRNARILHEARWQPVTHARVVAGTKAANNADIVIERYGSGDVFYFTLLNLGSEPVEAEVSIDLAALNLSPKSGEMAHIREIAHGVKVIDRTDGEISRVRTRLNPDETQILKLSRAW